MNESALKERLKFIATEKNTTLNKIWKQLALERFLARLAISSYQDKFIFKGGLLLAKYINIYRETVDIDFSMTKTKSEIKNVETMINHIAAMSIEDSFAFTLSSLEELSQPHMEYLGFRAKLNVSFGRMQDKIQVDIGVGDLVNPIESSFSPFEYKGKPIFAGEISLYVYPPETIFAEKLETVISKGVSNSRMKDYHDLYLMISEPNFIDVLKLSETILQVFNRRGTEKAVFIDIDEGNIGNLQSLWSNHLRGLGVFRERVQLPENIVEVIKALNHWHRLNLSGVR